MPEICPQRSSVFQTSMYVKASVRFPLLLSFGLRYPLVSFCNTVSYGRKWMKKIYMYRWCTKKRTNRTKKFDNLNHFGLSNNNFRPEKIFFNLQGFGTVTAKKLCKYQRFNEKKAKTPLFTIFVLSTGIFFKVQKRVNTSLFYDQPATNVVFYIFFPFISNILVVAIFIHLSWTFV